MSVMIHGKEYITVAERVDELHSKEGVEHVSIETQIISHDPVVVKATVTIDGNVFTGISAANPTKAIEKQSPYEVAETSAVGRALGFAGFGIVDGIASADEVVKASYQNEPYETKSDASHENRIKQQPSKSEPAISMEEFDNPYSEACKKCGGTTVVYRSKSENNPGREYYYCGEHKFSHWVTS